MYVQQRRASVSHGWLRSLWILKVQKYVPVSWKGSVSLVYFDRITQHGQKIEFRALRCAFWKHGRFNTLITFKNRKLSEKQWEDILLDIIFEFSNFSAHTSIRFVDFLKIAIYFRAETQKWNW